MGTALTSQPCVQLLDLSEATDLRQAGGKAHALARAIAAGHAVPKGVVVPAGASGRGLGGIADAVSSRLGEGRFAVRSSGVHEDGREHSHAGQLETLLHVEPTDLREAVAHCLASADALRAVRYGDVGDVAVLVQRMVDADAAGVAFSADPQTGERDVTLIEAVASVADRLVSGAASPEAWRVTTERCDRDRVLDEPVLSKEQALEIAALARAMQDLFGCPQDVEWAIEGGELWLLQSRPITALPAEPVAIPLEIPDGSWDRDDHHGVLSPLGWAWIQVYPKALAEAFAKSGAPIETMECTRIGGHFYQRMVMSGPESAKLPPRWVLWAASRLVPSLRRANRLAEKFLDEEVYREIPAQWESGGREAWLERIRALEPEDPRALSNEELLTHIERALVLAHEGLRIHPYLSGPSFMDVGKLRLFLEDELGWDGERVYDFLTGASTSTTQLHRELEELVKRHREAIDTLDPLPRTWSGWMLRCPELGRALAAWLADNRLRMLHYGPRHPTLGERPNYVLSIVENIVHDLRAEAPAPIALDASDILAEAEKQLPEDRAAELRRLVDNARSGYRLRDDNGIDTVSKTVGLLRHLVLELGRRIEPAIGVREHAVYLYPEEHAAALGGELDNIGALIERRRGEESWALMNRGPRHIGPPKPPAPPADVFPRGMARLLRIFSWLEEAGGAPEPTDGDVLSGVGVGRRVVTAKARVVHRPEDMASVRPGEVVVCRITSPEWAVGLGRVAALVTDEGGKLSHPAIIARELDVPAVLGAADATARIRSGDTVTVDPVAATVVLSEAVPSPR